MQTFSQLRSGRILQSTRLFARYAKLEAGILAVIRQPDLAVVSLDDFLTDRQSQTGAA